MKLNNKLTERGEEKLYIILIDSGTTNTRIRLLEDDQSINIIDVLEINIGARNTAIDRNSNLKMMIIQGIKKIIKQNSLKESQMSYIVGSGMLTSDLGILEIPHISAPARLIDFLKNCKIIISEDFFQIPFILVPGMKNLTDVTDINIDIMDMLRGEEVETFGLLEQLKPTGKGLIILPGSHTKYLLIGENQTLLASYSTLGGEVLSAIRGNTILSNSIGKGLIEVIAKDQLLAGYQASESVGLTRCFYHIRLQHLFSN